MSEATARAGANVALVKYWGKRDEARNLPAVGSISVTLADLTAIARVRSTPSTSGPRFSNVGREVGGAPGARMTRYLDWLAAELGAGDCLTADVETTFPVGAGLASSAAIHCAVAAAAASAVGVRVDRTALSRLARVGSGSAARSVHGGWVEWYRGSRDDGADSYATQILPPEDWPLALVAAIVDERPKDVPSRDGMRHTARTSPLYDGWLRAQEADLAAMRQAIAARDLARVGTLAEENCLRMHATCLAARPPVSYWSPVTLSAMEAVWQLRRRGTEAYFTIDAGPQVKVLSNPQDAGAVAAAMGAVPGVRRVLQSSLGPGVEILHGPVPWR